MWFILILGMKIGWRRLTCTFISRQDFFAFRNTRTFNIPGDRNIIRFELLDNFDGDARKAKHRICRRTIPQTQPGHGVITTIKNGLAIDNYETFHEFIIRYCGRLIDPFGDST